MGIEAALGTIDLTTAAVNTTFPVSGLDGQPQLILFWWSGRSDTSDAVSSVDSRHGHSWALGPSDRGGIAQHFRDGSTDTIGFTNRHSARQYTDAILKTLANDSVDGAVDLDSIQSDGFTLIIDDALTVAIRLHYCAIWGIPDIVSGTFTPPAGSGSPPFSVTGHGFDPLGLWMLRCVEGSSRYTYSVGGVGGMVPGTPVQAGLANVMDERPAGSGRISASVGLSDQSIQHYATASSNNLTEYGAVQDFISDGFRYDIDNFGEGFAVQYLAFGGAGLGVYAGELLTRTDGNDIVVSTPGVDPKVVIFFSAARAESTAGSTSAGTADFHLSFGIAVSPSARGCHTVVARSEQNPSFIATAIEHDAVYANVDNTGNLIGLMDLVSFDTEGFTCVMDDTDPSACWVGFFVLGDAPSSGGAAAVYHHLQQMGAY